MTESHWGGGGALRPFGGVYTERSRRAQGKRKAMKSAKCFRGLHFLSISLIWPLVIVNSDKLKTLPLGFGVLGGQYGFHFEWTMAAAVITVFMVL
jgi:hypothetical protein